jgi:hypothetical protein
MAAKPRRNPQVNIALPAHLLAWIDSHRDPNEPRPNRRGHRADVIINLIRDAMARELADRA